MADVRQLQHISAYVEYVVSPTTRRLHGLPAYVEYAYGLTLRSLHHITAYIEYKARDWIIKTIPLGSKSNVYVADAADVNFCNANMAEKNQFSASGKDLLIAWNSGASTYTVTVSSSPDPILSRTGDITTYSLAAGEIAAIGPLPMEGWSQTDGKIYVEASNRAVKLAVIDLSSFSLAR